MQEKQSVWQQWLFIVGGAFLGSLLPITYSTLVINAKVEQRVVYIEQAVQKHEQALEYLRQLSAKHEARLLRNETTLQSIDKGLSTIEADVKKLLRSQR